MKFFGNHNGKKKSTTSIRCGFCKGKPKHGIVAEAQGVSKVTPVTKDY